MKKKYTTPSCERQIEALPSQLICESEFAGSVTEDLIVSEDFQW